MPVPDRPYSCLGFTLATTLFWYNGGSFVAPSNVTATIKELIEEANATKTELGLDVNDYPKIALPDFCADVPYNVISCRVQDGIPNCSEDRPPIQVSTPRIISPIPAPADGRITPQTTLQILTNIPAFGTLETQSGGTWVSGGGSISSYPSNGANGTGTTFNVTPTVCTPIPEDGLLMRFTACDACCNDAGEFEQACDSVEFRVFACVPNPDYVPTKGGWVSPIPTCSGAINACVGSGLVPYHFSADNAIVTQSIAENVPFYLVVPKNICGDITANNFAGCSTIVRSNMLIEQSSLDGLQSDPNINSVVFGEVTSALGNDVDKVNFFKVTLKKVDASCNLVYQATNACGAPFRITIVAVAFDPCDQLPPLGNFSTSDTGFSCTLDTGSTEINLAINQKVTFAHCPPIAGQYTVRYIDALTSTNVLLATSAPNALVFTVTTQDIQGWRGSNLINSTDNILTVEFLRTGDDANTCTQSVPLSILG